MQNKNHLNQNMNCGIFHKFPVEITFLKSISYTFNERKNPAQNLSRRIKKLVPRQTTGLQIIPTA